MIGGNMMKVLDKPRLFVVLLLIGLILSLVILKSDIYLQVSFGFKIEPTPYVIEATPTKSERT